MSNFILLHVEIHCFSIISWKDYSFPIEWSWHLCQKSTDYWCSGFIFGLSVLLVYTSIFTQVPHCCNYCSFVVRFEIRKCESSNFCLFFFIIFLASRTLIIPYESENMLFHLCEKAVGILIKIALNLQITSGSVDIIIIVSFPIHEHGMSFYFFMSLISFSNVFQFSVFRCFNSFFQFIPRYFILLDTIVKELFP